MGKIIFVILLYMSSVTYGTQINIIDVPTAEVVNYTSMWLSFRLYSYGGVVSQVLFGVYKNVNIGCGWDVEKVIGKENTLGVNKPTLGIKIRLYDGSQNIPAFALGYDGQGYFYDPSKGLYMQREKGIYFVGTKEVLTPGLETSLGINGYDFPVTKLYGFVGLLYNIEDKFVLLLESDNMGIWQETKFSAGGRVLVDTNGSNLYIDIAVRDMALGHYNTQEQPDKFPERIIRINYITKF